MTQSELFADRRIFELLAEHGKLTLNQIAEATGMDKRKLILCLRQMHDDGIIHRNGHLHSAPLWARIRRRARSLRSWN